MTDIKISGILCVDYLTVESMNVDIALSWSKEYYKGYWVPPISAQY